MEQAGKLRPSNFIPRKIAVLKKNGIRLAYRRLGFYPMSFQMEFTVIKQRVPALKLRHFQTLHNLKRAGSEITSSGVSIDCGLDALTGGLQASISPDVKPGTLRGF